MSLLVSDGIDELQRLLNSIGQEADSSDFMSFLQKSVNYFYQNYDIATAKQVTDIILYPTVREYALPSDFASLIPPRKAGAESQSRLFSHVKEKDLYANIDQRSLAVEFDRNTPYLVAVDDENSKLVLHDCQSTSGVTISGDGSDLKVNDRLFVSGSSSLQFTVSASGGTTTLEFALDNTIDLSDNPASWRGFFDLYIPRTNTASLTSVKLRIGSSSTNYYQWTKTTRYRGNTLKGGWGKIGAYFEQVALLTQSGDSLLTQDGSTILLQGTPDLSAIDYLAIVITHGTTGVNGTYCLDDIFVAKGNSYELPYYTDQIIEASDGSFKNSITATTDTILTPPKTEDAFILKAAELLCSLRFQDSGRANYFARELLVHESAMKSTYPRQRMLRQTNWYKRANSF